MFRLFCLAVLAGTAVYDADRLEVPGVSCALLLGTAVISTPPDLLVRGTASAAWVWGVYISLRALSSALRSRVPIGMGDVKLLSILALMTDVPEFLLMLAAAGMLSGITAAVLLAIKKAEAGSEIAFVPFIAAAYAVLLLKELYVP